MLQAAFGGYTLVEGATEYIDFPTYYEPGFNLLSPLEISSPQSDIIFILIRKRLDAAGDTFENLDPDNISVTATDATNGETLSVGITSNDEFQTWNFNPSIHIPILLKIENQLDIANPTLRVRVIDCKVKDLLDNSFITFRIFVEENPTNLYFNYIVVHRKAFSDKNTFSIAGREAYVSLRSDSDSYIIVSPYAWLKESTKDKLDFSYPSNTSYYQRENTYNNEDFIFTVRSWSHEFVEENVSVMNIPGYKKAVIILIDNAIYNNIARIKRSANLEISVTGELSGIEDTFRINLFA